MDVVSAANRFILWRAIVVFQAANKLAFTEAGTYSPNKGINRRFFVHLTLKRGD